MARIEAIQAQLEAKLKELSSDKNDWSLTPQEKMEFEQLGAESKHLHKQISKRIDDSMEKQDTAMEEKMKAQQLRQMERKVRVSTLERHMLVQNRFYKCYLDKLIEFERVFDIELEKREDELLTSSEYVEASLSLKTRMLEEREQKLEMFCEETLDRLDAVLRQQMNCWCCKRMAG